MTDTRGAHLGDGRDKGTVYIEYSRPGSKYYQAPKNGKRQFTTIWWMEGFHLGPSWRAQVFFADPAYYVTYWKERGLKVVETNET